MSVQTEGQIMRRVPAAQLPRWRPKWCKPVLVLRLVTIGGFVACWLAAVGSASGNVLRLAADGGAGAATDRSSYAQARDLEAAVQSPFRFDFEEVANPYRGRAVEGYLYNTLSWTVANVRLRIESLDATGQVRGEAWGWALGHVPARGRAYFFVPISVAGASYRATVISFDKIMEQPQSP